MLNKHDSKKKKKSFFEKVNIEKKCLYGIFYKCLGKYRRENKKK